MPGGVAGNTFRAIELEPQATAQLDFPKFVEALLHKLGRLKEQRFVYYEGLRKKNTKWANGSRWSISFYERGTEKTTSYFRHLGIILAIRDLWTTVQFEFLKELVALKSAADR